MSVNQPMGQQDDDIPVIQIWLVQATEWLQKNLMFVLVLGAIVGVGYGSLVYYRSTVYEKATTTWGKFGKAQSAADFGEVAKETANTEISIWARLAEGESELRDGVRLQFTDRKSADSELKKAGEAFDAVIMSGDAPASARERAFIGKARFLEATSDGAVDKALEAYESFAKKYPESIYKQLVEERITALKSPSSKEFYAWFSKQNPKPEDRPKPRDGLPPGHPSIDSPNAPIMLPPIPDELYPANWTELQTSAEEKKEASSAEAAPATEKKEPSKEDAPAKPDASAEKPADTKPADAKPAESKPAESKPEASKPADSKPDEPKKADEPKSDASAK
jgi:hypothetical protein